MAIIESAVKNLSTAPFEIQVHLKRIQDFSNIPRNKNKFANFCRNSLRLFQEPIIEKLWSFLDTFREEKKCSPTEVKPVLQLSNCSFEEISKPLQQCAGRKRVEVEVDSTTEESKNILDETKKKKKKVKVSP